MPGATVVATNKSTGLIREAVTDEGGRYQLANLPAGVYSFKATQQGFKAFEQTELTVSLNSVTRLDVSLEIGVHGRQRHGQRRGTGPADRDCRSPPEPQAKDLSNLPVPLGRNYQQVYRMLPGFAPPINSHSIPTNPARSLEFSVNGTSDDQNNTRIDGVSTPTSSCRTSSPISRRSNRSRKSTSSPTAWTPSRGLPAALPSTWRPRAEPIASKDRRSSIHQPEPQSLADEVRRRRTEHGRQAEDELTTSLAAPSAARSRRTESSTSSATSRSAITRPSTTP